MLYFSDMLFSMHHEVATYESKIEVGFCSVMLYQGIELFRQSFGFSVGSERH